MNTEIAFTTLLLSQLNALIAGLTAEEAEKIASGAITLSISLHDGAVKRKALVAKGKKPKAVQMRPCAEDNAIAVKACHGRQQVRDILKDLSLKSGELKLLISALGYAATGKNKEAYEKQIVDIIGRQADSQAIQETT